MGLLSGLFGGGSNAGGGFFGSGAKQSEVTTTYDTTTNTQQIDQSGAGLALSNVDGFGVDSHDSTTLNNRETTIYNAIDAGTVKTAGDIIANGLDVVANTTGNALDFGRGALSTVERISGNSLDLFAELAAGSIDTVREVARDSMDANAQATNTAIDGFAALAKQSSESTDDKVSKVAAYGLAAIVLVMVLPALFRSGGKAVI